MYIYLCMVTSIFIPDTSKQEQVYVYPRTQDQVCVYPRTQGNICAVDLGRAMTYDFGRAMTYDLGTGYDL